MFYVDELVSQSHHCYRIQKNIHEVAIGQPRKLLPCMQGIANNRQTSRQTSLIHERHQVNTGTCQKDLPIFSTYPSLVDEVESDSLLRAGQPTMMILPLDT